MRHGSGSPLPAWLANVAANPAVALLVDHYADDWNELWWVRADGTGRVVDPQDAEGVRALSLLADRYPCFAALGAVLAVDVRRRSGWAASAAPPEAEWRCCVARARPDPHRWFSSSVQG